MSARQAIAPTPSFPVERVEHLTVNGRHAQPGTEVTVKGLGRVRFRAVVTNPRNGQSHAEVIWQGRFRCVAVERVVRVHHVNKTRES